MTNIKNYIDKNASIVWCHTNFINVCIMSKYVGMATYPQSQFQ